MAKASGDQTDHVVSCFVPPGKVGSQSRTVCLHPIRVEYPSLDSVSLLFLLLLQLVVNVSSLCFTRSDLRTHATKKTAFANLPSLEALVAVHRHWSFALFKITYFLRIAFKILPTSSVSMVRHIHQWKHTTHLDRALHADSIRMAEFQDSSDSRKADRGYYYQL